MWLTNKGIQAGPIYCRAKDDHPRKNGCLVEPICRSARADSGDRVGRVSFFTTELIRRVANDRLVGPLIRFYAHLVLALRTIGESVPDLAANAILQAYLKVLEMEGSDHLVAAYAACLRQGSGEESYARFLRCELP